MFSIGMVLLSSMLFLVISNDVRSEENRATLALHEGDECNGAAGSDKNGHCALIAIQLRSVALVETDPEIHEVGTWQRLKEVVEANEQGGKIHIRKGAHMTFQGTININEGSQWEIFSEGAVLDGKNRFGNVRMFYTRGKLDLHGLYLIHGKTDYAGAMYFDFGSFGNITNCTFARNQAVFMGGAIVAKGATLRLVDVQFNNNRAKNMCTTGKECPKHCHKMAQAVYVLSHTKLDVVLRHAHRSQDFFFDRDYDGFADFHCTHPRLGASKHRTLKLHVKKHSDCQKPEAQHHLRELPHDSLQAGIPSFQ